MTPSCNGLLPVLTQARKLYAYGEQQDYFNQPNCIGSLIPCSTTSSAPLWGIPDRFPRSNRGTGFVRYGNARHLSGLACVISNAGHGSQRMFVGQHHASEQWIDILHPSMKPVIIDKKGYGNFGVQAMSASVWVDSATVDRDGLKRDLYVHVPILASPRTPDCFLDRGLMTNSIVPPSNVNIYDT
jgi:alpha-amylase